ncbi:RNA polymerase sigma-70 factor [Marinilongibacter aquaticus]|uniref:RNA polymerase sigma factor n=1 Tax=Marinilongibacter aquaticus TaxID=2975157 RepID=UPI0021BD3E26|nr:RNA polymerase sigma-70 factor [Marinilongibacter aquaticus]UBM60869.1 RNA polymerase sigma-70 factor [Marinilongibacter aquaticus]
MTDYENIIKLKKGDTNGLQLLMEEYQKALFHYALGFVWSKETAEEITSDVFVKLWKKRADLESSRPLKGLLFRICHDLCIDHLRKTAKSQELRKEFVLNYLQAHSEDPNAPTAESAQLEKVKSLIEQLPKKCREVMKLRYEEGLSLAEISERLDISPNTVQNHLVKGLKILRGFLLSLLPLLFSE